MLNMLVNHPGVKDFDYRRLRVLLSGGAPIAPEVVRRIVETFGCDYIQTYGMTETSPYLTLSLLKEHLLEQVPRGATALQVQDGPGVHRRGAEGGDGRRPGDQAG